MLARVRPTARLARHCALLRCLMPLDDMNKQSNGRGNSLQHLTQAAIRPPTSARLALSSLERAACREPPLASPHASSARSRAVPRP